ncbi:uncharacterized protein LOC141628792 [Silene latifolia]|uniref:uncharacterized protein LOC141628792 n=1 Tax=Silene latifolia TaxID=37657 RepID=UPI003D770210
MALPQGSQSLGIKFFHQPFPNAAFQPNNPLHARAWRFPRSGPVFNLDPATLGKSKEFWNQCVLGFLVDYRIFKAPKLNDLIQRKWKTRGTIKVLKLGDLYSFYCEDDEDKEDLLIRSYATFFGAFMVFTRWFPDSIPRTIQFPYADIWVRVCGLPFEYLTDEVANVAGHLLRHHYEVDSFDPVPDKDYLRVKARLKMNQPLSPGFFLSMDGGYLLWVQFRYEYVFKYCVRCGKVGHIAACCRESIISIVSNLIGLLDRAQERGFAVF